MEVSLSVPEMKAKLQEATAACKGLSPLARMTAGPVLDPLLVLLAGVVRRLEALELDAAARE